MGNFAVSLKRLVEKVSLEVIYTPCDLDKISVEIAEVNRPGLFLAGYYDYFDKLRLQIMGLAEMNFLAGLTAEKRRERLDQLFRQQPPAVILCRNEELEPFPEMQELAKQHGVALLRSNETTCTMMGSLISVLNLELAPRITRHGVLVEVYGEGILILGDSGVPVAAQLVVLRAQRLRLHAVLLRRFLDKRHHILTVEPAEHACFEAGIHGMYLPSRVIRYSIPQSAAIDKGQRGKRRSSVKLKQKSLEWRFTNGEDCCILHFSVF